jgi:uncharacterized protein YbcC (UPF0753/DUF2309 family)
MNHAGVLIRRAAEDEAGHPQPERLEHIRQAIEHAAHFLPSQGPIKVFVHHNTLHPFEEMPFEDALRQALKTRRYEPFLPESHYRDCLVTGRIRHEELAAVLREDLGDGAEVLLGFLGTRFGLWMAMLEYPLQLAPSAELRWTVAETDALRRFRNFVHGPTKLRMVAETRHWVMRDLRTLNGGGEGGGLDQRIRWHVRQLFALFGKTTIERWSDATWESFCLHLLWRICHDGSEIAESAADRRRQLPVRHAKLLEEAANEPCDQLVDDFLIRFCAAFLDQGYANWRLPDRDLGFFRSFANLYGQPFGPPDRWLRGLRQELKRLDGAGVGPLESIAESLDLLGVAEGEQEAFLQATLQALPGWAGMIWQMETNAEWTPLPAPAGTLVEYLAVRLILDRLAAAHVARQAIGWRGSLHDLRGELRRRLPVNEPPRTEQHAFLAFQLAQVRGWLPQELYRLPKSQWQILCRELDAFDHFERRRILHRAYERRYRNQALDAIAARCRGRRPWAHESGPGREEAPAWSGYPRLADVSTNGSGNGPARGAGARTTPSFQIVCCIDDREESFRRHLEEIDPSCETFGAAGFFGVAMYYRGASDAHPRPLCPVIIKPQHYVNEEVAYTFVKEHRRRAETRRVLGAASHQVHQGSRTFFGGLLTALGGTLASIPLVARILFPRMTAQVRRVFGGFVRQPAVTQLALERSEPEPGPGEGHVGYSLDEMAGIVERVLRDIGLTEHFAPVVLMCGHGSSSLNNPHESAYNCGACSGGRGGPNARAFAAMANDPRVREKLGAAGLRIPNETTFVGAFHNTCDDSVTFFDLDRLPTKHRARFERICDVIDEARRRNAHERCRRFESAPLSLSPEAALRHVEARSEDLSEARPEYNHASNALCLVGHRWWSRNLFLDRRAFLQSYDPARDDEDCTILARVLAAVIPVCAGISLEYYFSCVDTAVLGCGSKLPHNITSLLGVMEGAASDLRPGLSQQMVEIHEPMRVLFVIESTPEAMLKVMDRNPVIGRLCRNEWVQLAVLDTRAEGIRIYRDGEFRPYCVRSAALPAVRSSADWYRGWRDHLGFAAVEEPQPT